MITLATVTTIIELGCIYSLVVVSAWLTSCVVKIYDLSMEGSFCLGGALTALLLMDTTIPAFFIIPVTILIGAFIGLLNGLLQTKLRFNDLLSGLIITTALFSINLFIAGPTKTVHSSKTIFSISGLPVTVSQLFLLSIIALTVIGLIRWLFSTQIGLLMRATGSNPLLLADLGKNKSWYFTSILMISNALTALAGSLFVQYIGFFSIWSGVGILLIALTGLLMAQLLGAGVGINLMVGAFLYQLIITLTYEFSVSPDWHKLITTLLMVILMLSSSRRSHA